MLVVLVGTRAGEMIPVPEGASRIGRDEASDIRFVDDGVSRRHAVLVRQGESVSVEDLGSTNGTWVEERRVGGTRVLGHGDRLRIGATTARLQFGATSRPAPVAPAPATARRGVSLGRTAFVGGLVSVVLLAAGVIIDFATNWMSGEIRQWIVVPLTGAVAALVDVARQALTRPSATADAHEDTGDVPSRPRRVHRAPAGIGVLVAIVVVGLGGAAVTYGVATATAFFTGNQAGTDRLIQPVEIDDTGIATTVESVVQTQDFTRVELVVRNGLDNTITLRLSSNASLSDADGVSLEPDGFRSDWSEQIPPGQLRRGTIVFWGRLPSGPTSATLAFASTWEQGNDGPKSLIVPGLQLSPFE